MFSGVVDTFAKYFEVRPTVELFPDDTQADISFYQSKIAYKYLQQDTFKAIEDAKNGIYGKEAERVIDAIIYLAGFCGSVKAKHGHYSFAHPFYHTSTQILKSNIKLHGEKVAFGIIVQLFLEERKESEILETLKLFSKYNANFTTKDFNLEKEDLEFISVQTKKLFPYADFDSEKIINAFNKADELVQKFRENKTSNSLLTVKQRNALENIPAYVSSRSLQTIKREYGLESLIKLSANENTLGFSEKVIEAIKNNLTSQYPDGSAYELRKKISDKFKVDIDEVLIGNGSFELIFLVALAFIENGDETISASPTFGWYKTVTQIMGGIYKSIPVKDFKVDLEQIANSITPKTKIIWLCNPNNPTGSIFTSKELDDFLKKVPENILVVLDEAYIDFVAEENFPDSISLIKKYGNIVSLRTFSKLEGLANFRVGYAIANKDFVSLLSKIKLPLNVSGPSQIAGIAALEDEDFKKKTRENADREKQLYYDAFDKLNFDYVKSNTNFIFVDVKTDSKKVTEEFLKNGILIRAGAEYGYPTMLRISIGTPEENKKVIEVLNKIFN